ncbi:MAG: hypothetical protein QM755_05210 [Luteolibacter sp.]
MIKFLDGPATGHTLPLREAPLYLRVAIGDPIRVLDGIKDKAPPHDPIVVYFRANLEGYINVQTRNENGGNWAIADYRLLAEQPVDEHLRTTAAWLAWLRDHPPYLHTT